MKDSPDSKWEWALVIGIFVLLMLFAAAIELGWHWLKSAVFWSAQ